MPRLALIAFIAFVASANLYGEESKPSPAMKRILEDTARKVRTNRQAFDKANEKPLAEARQELQDLSTKLIKDGKNMEAQAVLKQIDTLGVDVMRMANAPAPMAGGGGAVPQKPLLERLAGKWSSPIGGTYHTIERNGVTQEVFKTGKLHQGGQLKVMPDGTAEVVYPDGVRRTFSEVVGDKLAAEAYKPDGSLLGSEVLLRTK